MGACGKQSKRNAKQMPAFTVFAEGGRYFLHKRKSGRHIMHCICQKGMDNISNPYFMRCFLSFSLQRALLPSTNFDIL